MKKLSNDLIQNYKDLFNYVQPNRNEIIERFNQGKRNEADLNEIERKLLHSIYDNLIKIGLGYLETDGDTYSLVWDFLNDISLGMYYDNSEIMLAFFRAHIDNELKVLSKTIRN